MPSASFFHYCAELLDRYESDERVMMVSGNNHLFGHAETADSYYFSRYPHVWGWATWRRAWAKYDLNMTRWPEIRDRKLFHQYFPRTSERYHGSSSSNTLMTATSTWITMGLQPTGRSGPNIAPARNLVRNIEFDSRWRRTRSKTSSYFCWAPRSWACPLPTRGHPPGEL